MRQDANALRADFAEWCRSLRDWDCPRECFTDAYGLKLRAIQDLEQARSLPSRSLVVLLTAIEMDPDWMKQVAKAAKERLALLERCGSTAIK
jgi:hypothetical protein